MNKTLCNYRLDMALFVLLVVNAAALGATRRTASAADLSLGGHVHAISGALLALACLVHIRLHWDWLRAVLAGRVRGRIKLFMNGMVTLALLLAGLSGQAALHSAAGDRFHALAGAIALLGLTVHAVKHLRWMASAAKNLVMAGWKAASPTALGKDAR
jgi:hypothetical protein